MKKIFIALFVLFSLVACGAPVTGVVVGKDYDRGYTKRYEKKEHYSCGTESYSRWVGKVLTRPTRTKYCDRTVPATQRIPEDWDLSVKDEKGQVHEINVPQGDYLAYRIGDQYPKETR